MIKKIKISLLYMILILLALTVLWPLWFMVTQSITPPDELIQTIAPIFGNGDDQVFLPIIPSWPTLEPITEILLDTPQFFVVFWNTCKLTFPQIFAQILVGAPAAWAISRLRFRGRNFLYLLYIILMLLPFQVTMVPNYLVLHNLNLLDTIWAIILPGIFSAFPVFIMIKGFDAVPRSLIEAAEIDGAGKVRIFCSMGLPLGVPGILSAMVLGFLDSWNMLEQPMLFLEDQSLWPLSLYLTQITANNLGFAVVASLIMLLPAILIFLFGQKYLELGIQSSGIKE